MEDKKYLIPQHKMQGEYPFFLLDKKLVETDFDSYEKLKKMLVKKKQGYPLGILRNHIKTLKLIKENDYIR